MNNNSYFENNIINLEGVVFKECEFSHEIYGEGFYNFVLKVKRLSDNYDYIPITISDRLMEIRDITEGLFLRIKGQLRTYNNYNSNKNKLILTVFAREIEVMEDISKKNINDIEIIGFLCKMPLFRTTPFGREITDILVAVNRAYGKSDYIPCIVWGRNAKFANSLAVGDNIKIKGRLQSRNYQKKTDETVEERTAYEISVSKIEILKRAAEK